MIFSDLDGTLLDHDSYDWQPAAAVLANLAEREIPVVLVSSKTLAEIAEIRRDMGLPHPVVAENGAVIDVPDGYFAAAVSAGIDNVDRESLQSQLAEIRKSGDYDCLSFAEMGAKGIAAATGLGLARARLANERLATEPILWRDTAARYRSFAEAAAARGLRCTRGGRFVHLMGPVDKADAVRALVAAYRRKWPDAMLQSIALGDGPNDLQMLAAADIAVVIPGRHGQPMPLDSHARVLRPQQPGPRGWADAVRSLVGPPSPAD